MMKPEEVCDLQPTTDCQIVTSLIPHLHQREICETVSKEFCHTKLDSPKMVKKPITMKWCTFPDAGGHIVTDPHVPHNPHSPQNPHNPHSPPSYQPQPPPNYAQPKPQPPPYYKPTTPPTTTTSEPPSYPPFDPYNPSPFYRDTPESGKDEDDA